MSFDERGSDSSEFNAYDRIDKSHWHQPMPLDEETLDKVYGDDEEYKEEKRRCNYSD